MVRRGDRKTQGRRAVAAVECAVILIVLGILVVGVLEMGRALMVKEELSDAARRGCRAGILPLGSNAAIAAQVNKVLDDSKIKPSDATITVQVNDVVADASTAKQNDKISVAISVPIAKVCWIAPHFFANSSIESEATVMMRQR